ncbi:uncharacterized protein LOC142972749 [Anticarsia gemmatalis]|uniref:uncharacterized protein LOC142972749 n=1 Tax=Anticarsia gemmatalis TaxID=129554 RepID=UPI003F758FEA
MSSEGSVTSTGSRIRQFGLYRTIDARTEEFLRSSRRRQIRQGCACAAISTAITVTVVVVILLIYEYAIAVEWSLVQNKRGINGTSGIVEDQPFADRLDRSYFGFDQEYFERMPLLINALQENSYIDPLLETSPGPQSKVRRINVTVIKTTTKPTARTGPVRRTSPRPFYFEYRHPTPIPFSKTYGSRTWVERYRNEERLKNIRQIIKYLENTINAKAGDMHTAKPTDKTVAFSGIYVEPMIEDKNVDIKTDLQSASSDNLKKFHLNHLADPLFNFKPENPGDVNLLADDFLRFAPIPTPSLIGTNKRYPMFRQIPPQNRICQDNKCEEKNKENLLQSSSEIKSTETPPAGTTRSFSVMLNLYPLNSKTEHKKPEPLTTTPSINKIYLTTSRPLIQFKRKSNVSFRRVYTPYKRPRYLSKLINKDSKLEKSKETRAIDPDTQMIVHVKVYDEKKDEANETSSTVSSTTTHYTTSKFTPSIPMTQTNPYTTKAPIEFSTSQIEDYHVGSSGYIPLVTKSDKSLPKVTTVLPFFDSTTEYWNSPTEVVKFDIEDAKVPTQYIDLINNKFNEGEMEMSRRNSGEMVDRERLLEEMNATKDEVQTNRRNFVKTLESNVEPSTLVVKLRNDFSRSTTQLSSSSKEEEKSVEVTTPTVWTYVPQINGHYRSINQNSRNVNKWLNADPENNRKKRLEMSVSGLNTYVPMYVEIKRNNTKSESEESFEEDEDVKNN